MEEKLTILGTNLKSEEILHVYLIFCALKTFIAMLFRGNVHVWLGCTKTRRPKSSTALHWRPPDVQRFGTDPSLV